MQRVKLIMVLFIIFFELSAQTQTLADTAFQSRLRSFADSLQNNYLSSSVSHAGGPQLKPVKLSEQEIRKRLQESPPEIPVQYSPLLNEYIHFFQAELRPSTILMFSYMPLYFPVIEKELYALGLPQDLKYLPCALSFLNTHANPTDGLSGLWQLGYSTAMFYGMTSNSFIDMRRDYIASTPVALRYLSDLYRIYSDWELSLAAYLCTPSVVNKAIRRARGNTSYTAIYEYLPHKYRDVVYAFGAVRFLAANQKKLNVNANPVKLPATDTVMVTRRLHFGQVATVLNISENLIRDLNPVYKLSIIPAGKDIFILTLPAALRDSFILHRDSIYTCLDTIFNLTTLQDAAAVTQVYTNRPASSRGNMITHTVKAGENLSVIANRYKVSVNDIKQWNNLRSNTIHVNQRLTIYTHSPPRSSAGTSQPAPENAANSSWHTVSAGESFYSISKKFPGVSAEEIMKANNITNPQSLKAGQRLKIPQKP